MWLLYIIGAVLIIGCIDECYKELKSIEGSLFRIEQSIRELVDEQPTPNNVKCIDCEYLEFKMPYGICGEGYMGIVHPDDSCGKGKLEEKAGGDK